MITPLIRQAERLYQRVLIAYHNDRMPTKLKLVLDVRDELQEGLGKAYDLVELMVSRHRSMLESMGFDSFWKE